MQYLNCADSRDYGLGGRALDSRDTRKPCHNRSHAGKQKALCQENDERCLRAGVFLSGTWLMMRAQEEEAEEADEEGGGESQVRDISQY